MTRPIADAGAHNERGDEEELFDDDLTVDGADLLAELRAAQEQSELNDGSEDVTVEGADLLAELQAERAQVDEATDLGGDKDEETGPTISRWQPPAAAAETGPSELPSASRVGLLQLAVVAIVVVAGLVGGIWVWQERSVPASNESQAVEVE